MVKFIENQILKKYSTFEIGGPAKFFITVSSINEMQEALRLCQKNKLPFFILGKGSNTLFDDQGFDGVVILNKIDFFEEIHSGKFHVGGGFSFSLLGAKTARKGWSGLEFASGIPGTVGGAVFMNAGANGTETCDHLVSVDFVDPNGELTHLKKEEIKFSYRYSMFHENPGAIVGATFQLKIKSDARKKQIDIITYRKETQPYGEKSAGCMFRNPNNHSAGELIEKCGLKGFGIGGAKVSEKHANFIINKGNATSKDVLQLKEVIENKIFNETGIKLKSEVRKIPYNPFSS